jgi:uncharacterized membrane protein
MEPTRAYRIQSIDILRGIVMIIMALDHTRDFFHQSAMTADPLNPETTFPWLYFTRWITHFCAPAFVFLSGISAFLVAQRRSRKEASLFLIKRGFWLVLVEVIIVTFGITFNPNYNFIILQVIWAIGWSMIFLGIVSWISPKLVLALGLLLFFGHNMLDYVSFPQTGTAAITWNLFLRASGFVFPLDSSHFVGVFYAILPWTGVMFMGYSIGRWYQKDFPAARRKQLLLATGFGLILLFIVFRATNLYGNPFPFKSGGDFTYNLLSFLNTNKYPPSLLYLAMTLGPSCIMLALLENVRAGWTNFVSVYGKVPFFYYIIHFYLIHLICMVVFFATGHTTDQIVDPNLPFLFRPLNFGYGLWTVYAIWISVILLLYYPCKWFSQYKNRHKEWWLSYV